MCVCVRLCVCVCVCVCVWWVSGDESGCQINIWIYLRKIIRTQLFYCLCCYHYVLVNLLNSLLNISKSKVGDHSRE